MTVTVNMLQLGTMPSGYGREPQEGRKWITTLVNFSTDVSWFFDFTLLQQQKIFSYPQTLIIDNQLNTAAGCDIFVNNAKIVSLSSAVSIAQGGLPFVIPLFAKEPVNVLIQGRSGAGGTAIVTFLNYALLGSPKGNVVM